MTAWIGSPAGEWWATGTSADLTLDPLAGIVGALITATAFMGVSGADASGSSPSPSSSCSCSTTATRRTPTASSRRHGLFLGALLTPAPRPWGASGWHAETRTLVAAIVAVTTIGPIVALVNRTELTPFSSGSYLFDDDPVDLDT